MVAEPLLGLPQLGLLLLQRLAARVELLLQALVLNRQLGSVLLLQELMLLEECSQCTHHSDPSRAYTRMSEKIMPLEWCWIPISC